MNIIICGAGKVGFSISKQLSAQGHSVTVIDQSSEDIKKINDTQDVKGIVGRATLIGCNTTIVSPVNIGSDVIIGAGSLINFNVSNKKKNSSKENDILDYFNRFRR